MSIQAKITGKTKFICDEIRKITDVSQISILERAVIVYRRKLRMEALNLAFSVLKEDVNEMNKYKREQLELEGTLSDGLE